MFTRITYVQSYINNIVIYIHNMHCTYMYTEFTIELNSLRYFDKQRRFADTALVLRQWRFWSSYITDQGNIKKVSPLRQMNAAATGS